ncbi:hypothetical protein M6B38_311840 [Iris pallida]|uniref:Uncharacterized protein n=1 Tax=Iris pallida TaxID=29817 RepID=A0AAX6H3X3_IRIPA|nr:hypothetical protein M6B38_123630 [Iris pallida]KAJ6839854.1 hypothetical protein M6B38_311840 [Iris pallida]
MDGDGINTRQHTQHTGEMPGVLGGGGVHDFTIPTSQRAPTYCVYEVGESSRTQRGT